MKHSIFLLSILILLYFTGCRNQEISRGDSASQGLPEKIQSIENLRIIDLDTEPAYTIQFEREQVFEGWDLLAIDDDGRVFSGGGKHISVYHPDGSFITDVGGDGSGPGEFRSISAIKPKTSSEYLFGFDSDLQRINIYSLETLKPVDTFMLNPLSWANIDELVGFRPGPYFVKNDSTLLMGFKEPGLIGETDGLKYVRYYLMDLKTGSISDKIFEHRDANMFTGRGGSGFMLNAVPRVPYTRHALMEISDNGHIYSAWTEDFLIKVFDDDGNYLHAFYYPYTKSLLNRDDILQLYNSQQIQAVQQYDVPETWPALDQMIVDDENRLWISTITDNEDHYTWWVLDADGTLLAKFTWPGERLNRHIENRSIITVKGGRFYTLDVNEDTGIRQVVRHRIVMSEG